MPLTNEEIRGILDLNETQALGADDGTISHQRQDALDRYLGRKTGTEVAGQSQVVDTTVQDCVEAVLPSLIRVFLSTDKLIEILPEQEEDIERAEQATDYINWIFMKDNNGFLNLHSVIKNALIERTGYLKIWWDSSEEPVEDIAEGIDGNQLALLDDDESVEIIEQDEETEQIDPLIQEIDPATGQLIETRQVFNVKYKRTKNEGGRIRIEAVPPLSFYTSLKELRYSREAQSGSLSIDKSPSP